MKVQFQYEKTSGHFVDCSVYETATRYIMAKTFILSERIQQPCIFEESSQSRGPKTSFNTLFLVADKSTLEWWSRSRGTVASSATHCQFQEFLFSRMISTVILHVKIHVYKKDSPTGAVKNTANELIRELSFRKAIIYNICFSMYLSMSMYKSFKKWSFLLFWAAAGHTSK